MTTTDSPTALAPQPEPLPDVETFYIRTPLYEFFKVNAANRAGIQQLQYFTGTFDAFCPTCRQHSIFARSSNLVSHLNEEEALKTRRFDISFTCRRNSAHHLSFVVMVSQRRIGKIGQYPPLADLHMADIGRYRGILGEDRYKELSRAVGLAAHGIGIGSFVYLRRVFEALVEAAHVEAQTDAAWDEDGFQRGRMDDKILALKTRLPAFLVENRGLYSILSTGVHSLTEDECLRHFDTVKVGIELILDEHLERDARRAKLEKATTAIGTLRGHLAG